MSDPAALVKITSEVVSTYLAKNHVPSGEIAMLIVSVHAAFAGLDTAPQPAPEPVKPSPAVPIGKSVTDDHLISLEDGKPYKTVKRHLAKHDLTPDAYRAKWGLPNDYPMVASTYSDARSRQAKSMGLEAPRRKA